MAASSPWAEVKAPTPSRQYLFLLSYLRLRRYRSTIRFAWRARAIARQLATTEGVVGFSLRSDLRKRRFWTLSAWEDEQALRRFAGAGAHREGLVQIRRLISDSEFIRWHDDGSAVPPEWESALRRGSTGD